MSDEKRGPVAPEKGARGRVVLEGLVTSVNSDGSGFSIESDNGGRGGNYILVNDGHVVSIEQLSPPRIQLPTEPGSVVVSDEVDGWPLHSFFLTEKGWHCHHGKNVSEEFIHERARLRVVRDAGEARATRVVSVGSPTSGAGYRVTVTS